MEKSVYQLKSLLLRKLTEVGKETISAQKITSIATYHFTFTSLELMRYQKTAYMSQREAELLDLL